MTTNSDDDRYALGTLLGTGATSEVFSATDRKLKRQVAFKRLLAQVASDPTVRRSFHREAQALARVRHKNVVAVHDYSGPESPVLYLVMDQIEGQSLAAVASARSPIDEPLAWALCHELASGLSACHAVAVVHRDLKPENVILSKAGRLVLVDFGIARAYDDSGAVAASAGTQVMGTPDFMSPEQVVSSDLTGASDVFSLGVMLYFLLTGKRPFAADTMLATFKKLAAVDYLPVEQARPGLDPLLAALIAECMRKDPAARPTDADLVKRARERLHGLSVSADAILAGVASGAADVAAQVRARDLANTIEQLDAALARGDKDEARRLRRRVLQIDPDNTKIFQISGVLPTPPVEPTKVTQVTRVVAPPPRSSSPLARMATAAALVAVGFALAWAAVHFGLLH